MKLNIGPGKCFLPGWINIDIFSFMSADLYSNAMNLPYHPESIDLIYASHVLEHINKHMTLSALSHWRNLLRTGGILRIAVPNFEAICERYRETGDLLELSGLLYGGQKFILDVHYTSFDKKALTSFLQKVGFKEVREWDWRKTEHAEFDDFSQAYLPHLQKETGRLMSLNLEAVK
jgi:SAM-dependent methyltransferase